MKGGVYRMLTAQFTIYKVQFGCAVICIVKLYFVNGKL